MYINGLSSGSNLMKKSSVDMNGKEIQDMQQKGGQHLFKNIALVNAENAMWQQHSGNDDGSHYGMVNKNNIQQKNLIPGSA